MALVNIDSALLKVCRALKKCEQGKGVEVLSYKRNRGVSIIRQDESTYFVKERGYENLELDVSHRQLKKILQSIMKREFPRSRKVRIYTISGEEQLNRPLKKL